MTDPSPDSPSAEVIAFPAAAGASGGVDSGDPDEQVTIILLW